VQALPASNELFYFLKDSIVWLAKSLFNRLICFDNVLLNKIITITALSHYKTHPHTPIHAHTYAHTHTHTHTCIHTLTNTHHSAKLMCNLSIVSYFSPLVSIATGMPHSLRNFLQSVPPFEVSWSDIAMHVLHKKVRHQTLLNVIYRWTIARCGSLIGWAFTECCQF